MKTFLHVGCGRKYKKFTTLGFKGDDWAELRLDIDASVNPDIVGTMLDMSAVADASVDAIFSSHNIEHLYPNEVPQALAEFRRVLRADGFIVVTCPDLQSVCALVAEDRLDDPLYDSHFGPITPLDILYGHRPSLAKGNLFMAHHGGFTRKVSSSALHAAGFPLVVARRRRRFLDLWAIASCCRRSKAELQALAQLHFPAVSSAR